MPPCREGASPGRSPWVGADPCLTWASVAAALRSFSQVTPPNRVRLRGLPAHPILGGRLPPQAKLGGQVTPPRPNLGVRLPPHSKPAAQVTRRRPNPGYHQVQVTPPPGLGSQVTPPTARRGRGAARRGARASHRLVPRSIDYIAQKTGREKTPSTVFAQRSQTQPAWRRPRRGRWGHFGRPTPGELSSSLTIAI